MPIGAPRGGCARRLAAREGHRPGDGPPTALFGLKKDLIGMSARKDHCSIHTLSPSLVKAMAAELKGVEVSGATVHFTPEKPLPKALIRKILRRRITELGEAS